MVPSLIPLRRATSELSPVHHEASVRCFVKVFRPSEEEKWTVWKICSLPITVIFPMPSPLIPHDFILVCCPGEQSGVQPSQEVGPKDHPGWDTQGTSRWLCHSLHAVGVRVGVDHGLCETCSPEGRASEWEPQSKSCLRNRSPKAQQSPHCPIISRGDTLTDP